MLSHISSPGENLIRQLCYKPLRLSRYRYFVIDNSAKNLQNTLQHQKVTTWPTESYPLCIHLHVILQLQLMSVYISLLPHNQSYCQNELTPTKSCHTFEQNG